MPFEEIRFVVTPPCRLCTASPAQKRRFPCLGCNKRPPAPSKEPGGRLRRMSQAQRDEQIAKLRAQGLSYGKIAKRLRLPRSTVFNAAKRSKTHE